MKTSVVAWLQRNVMWGVKDGALTLAWLAMAEGALKARDLRGLYFHPQCERVAPPHWAANVTLQRQFWDFTQALTRK
jgi:hypothetical protein